MNPEDKIHFDSSELLERHDNNIALFEKVIPIAANSLKETMMLLETYAQTKDLIGIKQMAHRLKGTSKSLCLPSLIQFSTELEGMDFQTDRILEAQVSKINFEIRCVLQIFESLSKG